jgi:hypothetical protein
MTWCGIQICADMTWCCIQISAPLAIKIYHVLVTVLSAVVRGGRLEVRFVQLLMGAGEIVEEIHAHFWRGTTIKVELGGYLLAEG